MNRKGISIFSIMMMLVFIGISSARADDYGVIRRIVVFPFLVPDEFGQPADDAWWEVRERLTRNKRFLLASKYFLQKKDVFQPRGNLSPSDAIILGKLLDAHALVVTFITKGVLNMVVYSGEDGSLIWRQKLNLHQSIRVGRQLSKAAVTLINDFLAAFPYQGVHVVDPIIGQPVYEEEGNSYAKIEIGAQSKLHEGDNVQWIHLSRINLEPLFGDGGRISVVAEGKVFKVENLYAVVKIERAKTTSQLNEGDLIRFPEELKRLKEDLAIEEELKRKIEPEFISSDLPQINADRNPNKPLAASLAWISGIVAYLLLAF